MGIFARSRRNSSGIALDAQVISLAVEEDVAC